MTKTAPPLPKTVKIGYLSFDIENWDPALAAVARRFGECDSNNAVIRVSQLHGSRKAANTLLHEILHGCYFVFAIDGEDDEERTVGAVANALSTVWRDNPDVAAWVHHYLIHGG